MGIRFTFTLIGFLILVLLSAPIREILFQLIFTDKIREARCEQQYEIDGQRISSRNLYQMKTLHFLREHSCIPLKTKAEKYYLRAIDALKNKQVNRAKTLVEQSLYLYPDERKLVLLGEVHLIRANRRYHRKKSKNMLRRDYKYSRLKFDLAEQLANEGTNQKVKHYALQRIRCIDRILKKNKVSEFCGGYRK